MSRRAKIERAERVPTLGASRKHDSLAAVEHLERMLVAMKRGAPIAPADAKRFMAAIVRYIAGAASGLTLDRALGLAPLAGRRSWWTERKYQDRDAIIQELRERYFAALSTDRAATAMVKEVLRLERSHARRGKAGDGKGELIARALDTGMRFPKRRQLRNILSAGNELAPFDCQRGGR